MAGVATSPARPVAGSARRAAASVVVVPVRPRSRPTGAGSTPRSPSSARELRHMRTTRDTKRAERKRHQVPVGRDRRLHQRRQVLAAQPADRCRRPRRGRAVRDAGPDDASHADLRRSDLHDVRHRRASCGTCPTSSSRRSARRWRRSPTPTSSLHVVDGSHPDPEGQIAAVREVFAEIGADKVPELVVINKADAADPMVIARLRPARAALRRRLGQDRGGHRRGAGPGRGRAAPARRSSSRRCCPTSAATC